MKAFDPNYKLLDEMYQDEYYPDFLVDKIKDELQKVIDLLITNCWTRCTRTNTIPIFWWIR